MVNPSFASSAAARKRFQAQAVRETAPEMALRRELHSRGLRYRVQVPLLESNRRRVDIVFIRARVAVDVRGCWWHGCIQHRPLPKSNRQWWAEKLRKNVERDHDTEQLLLARGWEVVVVWEHEDMVAAADQIQRLVRERSLP